MATLNSNSGKLKLFSHPLWLLVASFGTYFCMYGFRKPYTAATFADFDFLGMDYKSVLIIAQTLGYVLSKWFGIKYVSEIKRSQRISAIIGLIGFAEIMLLLFGTVKSPWNVVFLFMNGIPLGVIFGLVLSFLEGRKHTEFLVAGLCASFIISDGISKSIGVFVLHAGISEVWMPFVTGLLFAVPTLLFIWMLSKVPAPSAQEVKSRSAREPMTKTQRLTFFKKYAPGISGIVIVYLLVTLLRSVRADFAIEIWHDLGFTETPALFTQSEIWVSVGVLFFVSYAATIKNHLKAFDFSLTISFVGLLILLLSAVFITNGSDKFLSMVMLGLGVYIPYVAIHSIVFERMIALTREGANVGFLMYIADSAGYTGYILLMLIRHFTPAGVSVLDTFLKLAVLFACIGIAALIYSLLYFKSKFKKNEQGYNLSSGPSCSI